MKVFCAVGLFMGSFEILGTFDCSNFAKKKVPNILMTSLTLLRVVLKLKLCKQSKTAV